MNSQLIISILIILLLFITLCICYRKNIYYEKCNNTTFDIIPIANILNYLQSGDIILFRSNIINYKYFIFSHSFFTHVGIVIKNNNLFSKNNNLYICEKNIPNTTIFGDSNINPLLDRIMSFNGSCYLMKLNKPLNFIREKLLKSFALKTFVDPILYPNALNSIKTYFKQIFKLNINYKYMHCFQYIAYILDYINITNNLYLYNNIEICNKVNNLFEKKLNDGYSYAKPIQIILNPSLHL